MYIFSSKPLVTGNGKLILEQCLAAFTCFSKVPGLKEALQVKRIVIYITEKKGSICIGAGVKINKLLNSSLLKERAPLLLRAAKEIGSPVIRNIATIGGNICSVKANCGACGLPGCRSMSGGGVGPCKYASHADLIPPLLALDAGLVLVGGQGERNISLQEFALGDKRGVEVCGIKFKNPVVVALATPTKDAKYIRKCVEAGAGGVISNPKDAITMEGPKPVFLGDFR